MAAQALQVSEMGSGSAAALLFALALPALAALIRWWMSGIDRRSEETTKTVASQSTALAVLATRVDAHETEIVELRKAKHGAATVGDVQAQEARCARRHREKDE